MKDEELERLIGQSLAYSEEPEEQLNQTIKKQLIGRSQRMPKHRKSLSAGLLAAVLIIVLSVSAYAATHLFTSKQVSEHLGDRLLAAAFDSPNAIQINQFKASGDYSFTLHGIVSGSGLSAFKHSSEKIYLDRSYAVISITRQDGKPMPAITEPEYGKESFFISPLIKGQKPWQINIASMNGAYSEDVIDGVMYRLIECDQVEIFADRGVYLAISSGTDFYSKKAFTYDETTGLIQVNEDYPEAAALFELPLESAKADHDKAEAYLKSLLNPPTSQVSNIEEEEWVNWIKALKDKIRNGETIGEVIPESVKEVTYDDMGNIIYTFGEFPVTIPKELELFEKGQVGYSDRRLPISGGDDTYTVTLFHRDEQGIITGRMVILSSRIPEVRNP